MQVSGQRPGETSGAYNRSLCRSAPVLSRYRAADSRAFRSAGSSLSSRARRRAGLVRTRGPGGLAGSGPRHLIETPRRDDRVCVAGHRDGRPAGRRGKRRCARIWTLRQAAASCSKGFPMFPVRDWIRRSRSCTWSGLVLDLSCTCRIPAPVTSLITSQRRPLVASAREVPGRLIRGVP